jgi:hypothetical protein
LTASSAFEKWLRRVATALLAGVALLNVGYMRKLIVRLGPPSDHPISRYEEDIRPVRAALPDRGRVAYLSDTLAVLSAPIETRADYAWAQYALAPLALIPGGDGAMALGQFRIDTLVESVGPEWVRLKDFGRTRSGWTRESFVGASAPRVVIFRKAQ